MKLPVLLLDIKEMLEVFGFFLMVLTGLELLESIKACPREDRIHAEVVFLVALVAVSRRVIIRRRREPAYTHGPLQDGRPVQSFSRDGGLTWYGAEPAERRALR